MCDNWILPCEQKAESDGITLGFLCMWLPRLQWIWNAVLGEVLLTYICHAVKKQSGQTVGHPPKQLSSMFIDHCSVTCGLHNFSRDNCSNGA